MRPVKVEGPKVTIAAGLVLAEFDIDTGSCMRACYPKNISSVTVPSAGSRTGVSTKTLNLELKVYEQYFANHMLPDGAEKLTVGRTVFVVNRPKLPAYVRLPIYRFSTSVTSAGSSLTEDPSGAAQQQAWTRVLPTGKDDNLAPDILLVDSETGDVTFRQPGHALPEPCPIPMEDYITLSSVPSNLVEFERTLIQAASTTPAVAAARRDGGAPGSPAVAPPSFVFVMINRDTDNTNTRSGFFIASTHYRTLMDTLTQAFAPRTQPTPEPNPDPASEAAAASTAAVDAVDGASGNDNADDGNDANNIAAILHADAKASDSASSTEGGGEDGTHAEVVEIESDPAPITGADTVSDGPAPLPPHQTNPFAEEYSSPLHAGDAQAGSSSAASHVSAGGADDAEVSSTASGTVQLQLPDGGASTVSGYTAQNEPTDNTSAPVSGVTHPAAAGDSAGAGIIRVPLAVGDGCTLYGLCAVVSKRDSSVRRGGITKSVALLGPSLAWLDAFFPVLVEAARYCCDIRGSDADAVQQQSQVLKMCFDTINKAAPIVTAGMAKTSQLVTEVSKFSTYSSDIRQLYAEVRETPFDTQHKLKIPLSPASHDIRFNRYSLEGMIEALGPSFMHLVLGVLTEKKIVVLSRQGLSTDVCEASLSIGLIGNLIDPHFMEKKVFPYTSINGVESFLHVPGYVLGTLNPIFENERHFQWDLLCDLDARTVVFSGAEKKRGATAALAANWNFATAELANAVGVGEDPAFKGVPPHAARLFKVLAASVYRMRALRLPPQERNRRLRLLLEEYVQLVATMLFLVDADTNLPAPLQPLTTDPDLAKLGAQMRMSSFADAPLDGLLFPTEPPELLLITAALRRCREANASALQRLLQSVLALLSASDERVLMFLRRTPVALSGLDPLGYQLLHPAPSIQAAAFAILKRIEAVPLGKAAISAMSNFLVMVYENMVLRDKQRAYYVLAPA